MALATGQITIIDYNDALTLTGFISSSQPKTQQYNPDTTTYAPDWTGVSTHCILTPSLFKLGSSSDIIATATSVKWYEASAPTTQLVTDANAGYTVSATTPFALTIAKNKLAGLPSKDWICEIVYHDASTNLDLTTKLSISFSRVVNGGGLAAALATAPDGNIFKNDNVTSIKVQCDLMRGGNIDTSLVTWQWFKQDPSITSASGSLYDANAGAGWQKLTDAANIYTGCTTNLMTVYPNAVDNYAVFRCQIYDNDPANAGGTYQKYFYDSITVVDQSDPIQISVVSSGGDVFKNGIGSTNLTAKVYQAGAEIDSVGTKYTYHWFKYGNEMPTPLMDPNFGGTGINFKTGKTITVDGAMVDVKATFVIEIS